MSDYVVNINTAIQKSRLTKRKTRYRRKLLPNVDLAYTVTYLVTNFTRLELWKNTYK